jgi:hypothetical protein
MVFQLSIVTNTNVVPNQMICITLGCIVHLYGHWNKMMLLMKPFILVDLSNGTKFYNYTYCSTNDTHNHYLSCRVKNHHINKKDLIFTSHVKIGL